MKNKMKKAMAFIATASMMLSASAVMPYSSVAFALEDNQKEVEVGSGTDVVKHTLTYTKVDENNHKITCDQSKDGSPCSETDHEKAEEAHDKTGTDGACSKCGYKKQEETPEEPEKEPKVAGMSLALSGKIGVSLYFTGEENDVVEIDGESKILSTLDSTTKTGYYIYTVYVAPKDYAKEISVKIGNGEATSYSVATYIANAEGLLTTDEDALVEKMKAYCKAAAAYFTNTREKTSTATSGKPNDDNAEYYGSSLILESGITVRTYYKLDETTGGDDAATTTKYYYVDKPTTIANLINETFDNNGKVSTYLDTSNNASELLTALKEYAEAATPAASEE